MKKVSLCLAVMFSITAACSFHSFGYTKYEIINSNSWISYQEGRDSVYGPSLNKEQLEAVAQAVADFKTAYIKDGMSEGDKIRTINTYLFKTVSYAETWSENSANTAYGALVNHTAQCSGFARAFKALCDAADIECYYVKADQNAINPNHQWNIVKYNGNYYHIDVQLNSLGKGGDACYLSSKHPCSFDESKYPRIASSSAKVSRYYNGDGPYATAAADIQLTELPKDFDMEFPSQADGPVGTVDYGVCQAIQLPSDVGTMIVTNDIPFDESKYNLQVAIIPYKGQKSRETGTLYLDVSGDAFTNFQYLRKGQPVSLDPLGQGRSAAEIADYCRNNDVFFEVLIFDGNAYLKFEKEHGQVTLNNLVHDIPNCVKWFTY